MSSVRIQIEEAMVSAWNDGTTASGPRPVGIPALVRSPFREQIVDDGTPIRTSLQFLEDDPTLAEKDKTRDETAPARIHSLMLGLEIRGCGSDSDIPEDVVDPCECWAVRVWNDNMLGGLVTYLRTAGTIPERANEDRPLIKLLVAVHAKYMSETDDFEAE